MDALRVSQDRKPARPKRPALKVVRFRPKAEPPVHPLVGFEPALLYLLVVVLLWILR